MVGAHHGRRARALCGAAAAARLRRLVGLALVVVSSRLMGLQGWWRPAVLALGVTGVAYLLFARWLGVPLP